MGKQRTELYLNFTKNKGELIYTGINFEEFVRFLNKTPENLLLLKAEALGNDVLHNFELIEGSDYLEEFIAAGDYRYGDFCLVDYGAKNDAENLSDDAIAQMLFLAHMFRPINTAYFDALQNQFAYLAHDDGFFCKLFCRNFEMFYPVVGKKISRTLSEICARDISEPTAELLAGLFDIAEQGLYVNIEDCHMQGQDIALPCHAIGKFTDIDIVYNTIGALKSEAVCVYQLIYSVENASWTLEKIKCVRG